MMPLSIVKENSTREYQEMQKNSHFQKTQTKLTFARFKFDSEGVV